MQKILFAVGALALLTAATFFFQAKNQTFLQIDATEQFYSWKDQYNKNYNTKEEELYRLAIFTANYKMIQQNNRDEKSTFKMGVNQFMDLTNVEFKATYLGTVPVQQTTGKAFQPSNLQVPTSVNWTAQGDVTPVKDQGQCGSCWAFSTTGSLESDSAIFGSGLQSFSEQQLVDCSTSYGNHGCNGGLMDYAFNYVIANGITTEAAYPYTGVQGKCKVNGGAFKIKSYTNIPKGNCNALQAAVAQQPTSVGVDAQTWQFYSSGVFSLCGDSIDHGVLAVGYTPTYWIVKNSWGVSWGMQGYINLKTGNTCAICNQASYPNLN